ncbi:MAG: heparinase II/III family protein [Gemmatimonadaceae bacterium]
MSVLLGVEALARRRAVAGDSLVPLAASLRSDLAPLLATGAPWIPPEKARMTRTGGRCPDHGVLLEFDPQSPRSHRCPSCATRFDDDVHYRWWIMNYQLWLAERAVHASVLHALGDDPAAATFARDVLSGYCSAYDGYPNRDNVLGPTRLFFSTYLESIWLLQVATALDLLESRDGRSPLGDEVRERVLRPSAALIASYDEGMSNRQVYNNAALAAAGALLGDDEMLDRALDGPSGLRLHLLRGLLTDGTWYEGENYHLFAHRGLWYGVTIAEANGRVVAPAALDRFHEAFAAPFATALPDFTFPSRRDSQYRISLRQWRMAESCELGLVRTGDARLESALAELYRQDVPTGVSGRQRSTAEADSHGPPVRLTRASLGWKSLLFALPELPPLVDRVPESAHLVGQGIAVMRRDEGRVYAALDYGESGGGHGHPDRLNLWLVVGDARILEDVGTGSYVDPTLHWYRSTLAHNAPVADGRSQWRADGELLSHDERGHAGLVAAAATIAPEVRVERTLVVMPTYVIDEVRWTADRTITFDLPWHLDAHFANDERWRAAPLSGGRGVEDGYDFVLFSEHAAGEGGAALLATVGDVSVRAWISVDVPHEWWRCVAPGPPGEDRRRFLILRARERAGCIRSVWSWHGDSVNAVFAGDVVHVSLEDGQRHEHRLQSNTWQVVVTRGEEQERIDLSRVAQSPEGQAGALIDSEPDAPPDGQASGQPLRVPVSEWLPEALGSLVLTDPRDARANGTGEPRGILEAVHFELTAQSYRRSEDSWSEAGEPQAVVAIAATPDTLAVEVAMRKAEPTFAPRRERNELDNEDPDINSDGVQLHLGAQHGGGRYYTWILVPEADSSQVRVTPRGAFGPAAVVTARWRLTSFGYILRALIPRSSLGESGAQDFTLDVIVNEISPGRERRRGQLVLSGGFDEWIYLRGDRQDPSRALSFHFDDT